MDTSNLLSSSRYSALLDVGNSTIDLNTASDLDHRKLSAIDRNISKHGKIVLLVSAISLICSLALFIGAVVLFHTHPNPEACNLDSFSSNVQEQRAIAASQGKLAFNQRHNLRLNQRLLETAGTGSLTNSSDPSPGEIKCNCQNSTSHT